MPQDSILCLGFWGIGVIGVGGTPSDADHYYAPPRELANYERQRANHGSKEAGSSLTKEDRRYLI